MNEASVNSRVLLVTGAASGIGASIAQLAVARGHRVMLSDVNEQAVQARALSLGSRAAGCVLDIRPARRGQGAKATRANHRPRGRPPVRRSAAFGPLHRLTRFPAAADRAGSLTYRERVRM